MTSQTEKRNAPALGGTPENSGGAAREAQPHYTTPGAGLSIARAYYDRGLAVIPVRPGQKVPALAGWQERRLPWDELEAYLARDGQSGLGIVTGQLSGNLAILDFDGDGWAAAFEHWCYSWPELDQDHAPTVQTGSGRRHVWIRCPDMPKEYTRRTFERPDLKAAIELRGNLCQTLAPPSVHPSGNRYEWVNHEKVELPTVAFGPLLTWLTEWAGDHPSGATVEVPVMITLAMRERLRQRGYTDNAIDDMTPKEAWMNLGGLPERASSAPALAEVITEGGRNSALTSLAGSMRRRGASESAILAAITEENAQRCTPPLPDNELQAIARSVARYEPAEQKDAATAEPAHLTDQGNAERLVAKHGRDLLYCATWGTWLVWDGARWAKDQTQEVERRAVDTVRAVYAEASKFIDPEYRKAIAKHAMRSEAANKLQGMIRLAQPLRPAAPDQFDKDPMILNVQNGRLDLATAQLTSHDPAQMITKLAPVTYDPAARCPRWEAFLDRIMAGNQSLIEYLQMAAGYSLTGDTSEQKLFILYGTGANGKSTFLETLRAMLGDYGQVTRPETLLAKRSEGIPNDVAALRGARMVSTTETGDGRRLAEAQVKQLTGGDTISARFMRGEFFEFMPVFKLWLATNHKPQVRGTDQAIWRRIKLIPFMVAIPEPEQDKQLKAKLREELPGILNWALTGCQAWLASGLPDAPEVRQATAEYRAEMDTLAAFLSECCDQGEGQQVRAKELYEAYKKWCEDNGEQAVTNQAFGRQLTERGLDRYKDRAGAIYMGLSLR